MLASCCRVVFAAGLLVFSVCPAVSAQISLGIGNAAHREAETRILRQLESRDSFIFNEIPLATFVQAIRDRFGINVTLDRKALDDFAIDIATPVSVHLRDATLESSLNLVLESLDLTWTLRHESLIITTLEQAEARLDTRVYPVRDLVLVELERTVDADFDTLMEMITSTIEPDSWDDVGGPGAIDYEWRSLSLVISQTWRTHRQLEQLLTTLRAARSRQGVAPDHVTVQPAAAMKAPRQYRATASSAWQRPRVYED